MAISAEPDASDERARPAAVLAWRLPPAAGDRRHEHDRDGDKHRAGTPPATADLTVARSLA